MLFQVTIKFQLGTIASLAPHFVDCTSRGTRRQHPTFWSQLWETHQKGVHSQPVRENRALVKLSHVRSMSTCSFSTGECMDYLICNIKQIIFKVEINLNPTLFLTEETFLFLLDKIHLFYYFSLFLTLIFYNSQWLVNNSI